MSDNRGGRDKTEKEDTRLADNQFADVFQYKPDQKIFCLSHQRLYEARCIQTGYNKSGEPRYKIHYHGWSKKWDEWVPVDRIKEFTEENRELSQNENNLRTASNVVTNRSSSGTNNLVPKSSGAKQSLSSSTTANFLTVGDEEVLVSEMIDQTPIVKKRKGRKRTSAFNRLPPINLKFVLTDRLKNLLVDDYFNISRNRKLVRLPSLVPVSGILSDYVENRCQQEDEQQSTIAEYFPLKNYQLIRDPIVMEMNLNYETSLGSEFRKCAYEEIANSIKLYFDTVLEMKLLYQVERRQYEQFFPPVKNETDGEKDFHAPQKLEIKVEGEDEVEEKLEIKLNVNSNETETKRSRKNSDVKSGANSCSTTKTNLKTSESNHSKSKQMTPSLIYGGIHLLRLLTRFAELLAHAEFEESVNRMIEIFIRDFIKYLDQNCDRFFSIEYTSDMGKH